MVRGLAYDKHLRELVVFKLEKRSERWCVRVFLMYLKGCYIVDGAS